MCWRCRLRRGVPTVVQVPTDSINVRRDTCCCGSLRLRVAALEPLSETWLRERYFLLLKTDDYHGEIGEDDFAYTWDWFQNILDLFRKAAGSRRAVIFTVDG